MPENEVQPTGEQPASTPTIPATPAPSSDATLTTDKTQEADKPKPEPQESVSYSRFVEVNNARKKAEDELNRIKQEQEKADKKRKQDEGKWQELYENQSKELDEYKPFKERYEKLETLLKAVNEKRIADIPESMRSLVPTQLDPVGQFEWLSSNAHVLTVPKAPNLDPGARGDAPKIDVKLTPEEMEYAKTFGLTPEQYAKSKAAKPK